MRVDGIVGLERAELARAKHREDRITGEADREAAAAPRRPEGSAIVAGDGARVMVNDHGAGGGGATELELALLMHVGDEPAGAAPELDVADRSDARGLDADVSSAARARAAGAGEPPGDPRPA